MKKKTNIHCQTCVCSPPELPKLTEKQLKKIVVEAEKIHSRINKIDKKRRFFMKKYSGAEKQIIKLNDEIHQIANIEDEAYVAASDLYEEEYNLFYDIEDLFNAELENCEVPPDIKKVINSELKKYEKSKHKIK